MRNRLPVVGRVGQAAADRRKDTSSDDSAERAALLKPPVSSGPPGHNSWQRRANRRRRFSRASMPLLGKGRHDSTVPFRSSTPCQTEAASSNPQPLSSGRTRYRSEPWNDTAPRSDSNAHHRNETEESPGSFGAGERSYAGIARLSEPPQISPLNSASAFRPSLESRLRCVSDDYFGMTLANGESVALLDDMILSQRGETIENYKSWIKQCPEDERHRERHAQTYRDNTAAALIELENPLGGIVMEDLDNSQRLRAFSEDRLPALGHSELQQLETVEHMGCIDRMMTSTSDSSSQESGTELVQRTVQAAVNQHQAMQALYGEDELIRDHFHDIDRKMWEQHKDRAWER